ncbi:serpin family protein [Thermococcus sp.]
MREFLAIVVVIMVIASGCITAENGRTSTASIGDKTTHSPTENVSHFTKTNESLSIVDANNNFGIELYRKLSGGEEGNVFISPFSVFIALSMAYEGARGETAREMMSVLHLPENDSLRRSEFRTLLLETKDLSGTELNIANALWVQRDYPIRESYVSVIRNYYLGDVREVDFKSDPTGAERLINGWVENETKGKIKNLVSNLNPDTRLIITNAVYFKANWSLRFNPSDTHNDTFTLSSGEMIMVSMMTRLGKFNYTETDEFQAIEMPYTDSNFSMVIILPKEKNGLKEIENELSPKFLSTILSSFKREEVKVTIPKFKFEGDYSLGKILQGMGMREAFTDRADFSGISEKPLAISDVVHKTFIRVAENGTEAAAATAVIVFAASAPGEEPEYKVFRADHPFIFMIINRESGMILFIGRLEDPRG